jgi:hypothetical protein
MPTRRSVPCDLYGAATRQERHAGEFHYTAAGTSRRIQSTGPGCWAPVERTSRPGLFFSVRDSTLPASASGAYLRGRERGNEARHGCIPVGSKKTAQVTNIPFANSCRSTEYLRRRSPRLVFHVVGLSRDDMPTVVQAGGNHPGSQRNPPWSLIHAAAAVTQITKVTLWVLD